VNDHDLALLTPAARAASPAAPEASEGTEGGLLRQLLRERCARLVAPQALRQRILASLPHRSPTALA
jgi:hypothetical protein